MDRLLSKLDNNEVALGVMDVLSSPEIAMTMAASGLDYVTIDQMFTSTDWERTAHIIRAAKATGISPMVRLQTSPWIGGTPGLAAQCIRAQGIGATSVMASTSSREEVEAMVAAATDWHREIHIIKFHQSMDNFGDYEIEAAGQTLALPLLESQTTIEQFDEILSVEGLKAVFLGISDLSRVLGYPFQYEHPEVWRMIDKIVAICEKRGIVCGGNTGYEFQTPETIAPRVCRLVDHGIRLIMIQTDGALFQFFTKNIMNATTEALASPRTAAAS